VGPCSDFPFAMMVGADGNTSGGRPDGGSGAT